MKILYLHGLDSKLSVEKRSILGNVGTVLAPDLNYYEDKNAIETILEMYEEDEIDVVIGSSMGGFAGYYVANRLSCPALLFNPALKKRSVAQTVPLEKTQNSSMQQFVIGQQDEVVNPTDTLAFLGGSFNLGTHFHLHLVPGLGHRIPEEIFNEEVTNFFDRLY
ncbi:YqiA/YcfP family alpha/beta fold hydrolase [Salinimicrobium sp. GXAS 041]|uniref:YqiA/YcfP family alpha/beta fold hydrolase n=1 Tax=Salinimicrobium sp. GXAS 041 TaxID=3400806 RepID=UPI003C716938